MKCTLVVIDNFSRFMMTRPMVNKTAAVTARHLESILDEIKRDFNKGKEITKIITDDGSEFKGEVITLLKERDIGMQRTLGGNPASNGLVERSSGKLKIIISSTKLDSASFLDFLAKKQKWRVIHLPDCYKK